MDANEKRRTYKRVYMRAYRKRHPENKVQKRAYRQRPEVKAHHLAYHQQPGVKEKARAYRARPEVKEKQRARQRTAYHAQTEMEKRRAYRRQAPEIMKAIDARKRAKRRGAIGSHTAAEWRDKCALLGNVCMYCGESKPLTRDHKLPISRGGSDYITNIVPACTSCNSRKFTLTSAEFIALRLSA